MRCRFLIDFESHATASPFLDKKKKNYTHSRHGITGYCIFLKNLGVGEWGPLYTKPKLTFFTFPRLVFSFAVNSTERYFFCHVNFCSIFNPLTLLIPLWKLCHYYNFILQVDWTTLIALVNQDFSPGYFLAILEQIWICSRIARKGQKDIRRHYTFTVALWY